MKEYTIAKYIGTSAFTCTWALHSIPLLICRVLYEVVPPFAAIRASTLSEEVFLVFRSLFMGYFLTIFRHFKRNRMNMSVRTQWQVFDLSLCIFTFWIWMTDYKHQTNINPLFRSIVADAIVSRPTLILWDTDLCRLISVPSTAASFLLSNLWFFKYISDLIFAIQYPIRKVRVSFRPVIRFHY